VTGHVIDDAGRPVEGAWIEVAWLPDAAAAGSSGWRELEGVHGWTSHDGSFTVSGVVEGARVALSARHRHYTSGPRTECGSVARDVTIVVGAAGSVSGLLRLDPEVPAKLFQITARTSGEAASDYRGRFLEDGEYEVPGLPAGTYEVLLALEHEPETALRFERVAVSAGTETWLPETDLRGRVTTFGLHVRDAAGEPPVNAFVRRRAPGDEVFGVQVQPIHFGEARLATLWDCVDLKVEAPGHRPAELECVTSDRKASLEAGTSIRLVLEDDLPGLGEGLQVGAMVDRRGTGVGSYGRMCRFDALGIADTTVEEPGTYDVRVYVWRQEGAGGGDLLSSRIETTLELLEGLPERSFTLRLSQETLARIRGKSD